MPVAQLDFTTGQFNLPDVGILSYNGCVFSPLLTTTVSGVAIKDEANRTVKYMEYTLIADGYVTLRNQETSISATMGVLRDLLDAQGGSLVYQGRGFDLNVNPQGAGIDRSNDVAWGPVPETLDFQPLGGGLSAKVKWQVKVRITEVTRGAIGNKAGLLNVPLLQFNYETNLTYDEQGYSSLSMRGVMEIPLTRATQATRTIPYTVDDARSEIATRLLSGIDLTRFTILKRDFNVSRDKRLLEWNWHWDEKGYCDYPPDSTLADGLYSVRPVTAGFGLCQWYCTLSMTYTIAKERPRRAAWFAFFALMREKMRHSTLGIVDVNIPVPLQPQPVPNWVAPSYIGGNNASVNFWNNLLDAQNAVIDRQAVLMRAWLVNFSFEEGQGKSSRTTSFSATWQLASKHETILMASGLWRKLPEKDAQKNNLWVTSVRGISGTQSWLQNPLDPKLDVIVDFGGG